MLPNAMIQLLYVTIQNPKNLIKVVMLPIQKMVLQNQIVRVQMVLQKIVIVALFLQTTRSNVFRHLILMALLQLRLLFLQNNYYQFTQEML